MRVLIFEHVCGGGMAGEPLPPSLLAAGQAMWRAVVEDFAAAGCEVATTLDARLAHRPGLGRGSVGRVAIATIPETGAASRSGRERPGSLHVKPLAKACDAALIIAPETGGLLEQWATRLRQWKVRSLGGTPRAIALCADKAQLNDHLLRRGVPAIPGRTGDAELLLDSISHALHLVGGKVAASLRDAETAAHVASGSTSRAGARPLCVAERCGYCPAFIVKPRDGAGCENTFVLRCPDDVESVRAVVAGGGWLAQPYVHGLAASVSFVGRGRQMVTLPAGRQMIKGGRELHYAGGQLPLDRKLSHRAAALAQRAVAAVPGLRGFVGVDLLLGERADEDIVVEINPRVTMSYCGLRRLCRTNLAKLMLGEAGAYRLLRDSVAFDSDGEISEDSTR